MPEKTVIAEETLRKQILLLHLSNEIHSRQWNPNENEMLEITINISPVINLYAHWDDLLYPSAELCKNKYVEMVQQTLDELIQSNVLPADTTYEVFLVLAHSYSTNGTHAMEAKVVLTRS